MDNMLRSTGENIRNYLQDVKPAIFKHVDFYEGQFEHFDEEIVYPPACYVDYQSGEPSEVDDPLGSIDFVLYLIATKLDRIPGNMLDTLQATIAALHKKPVRFENDDVPGAKSGHVGKLFYKGFRNNPTFPGLIVWEVMIRVER